MSTSHGGPVTLKPIGEIAEYVKNLIPANIPETYKLKPMLTEIADEEDIRNGIIAFRDFLFQLCDRIISDGHLYDKPPKNPKHDRDYPFFQNIEDLLIDIGYHGILADNGESLAITGIPSLTGSTGEKGNTKKPKIPIRYLQFLVLCGFEFTGIDIEAKTLKIPEDQIVEVSYPKDPVLLIGLKAMAVADAQPRGDRWRNGWRNSNVFLRCDYTILKAEDTDLLDILKDFVYPLPDEIQRFVLELHQHHIGMGMTCLPFRSLFEHHFVYAYTRNSRKIPSSQDIYNQRMWEFDLSLKYGYCLVVRAKHMDKYADVTKSFPAYLREKIARGYGCDRKLRGEPCQTGCYGIRIPLKDAIPDIGSDIQIWLDHEASYSMKK